MRTPTGRAKVSFTQRALRRRRCTPKPRVANGVSAPWVVEECNHEPQWGSISRDRFWQWTRIVEPRWGTRNSTARNPGCARQASRPWASECNAFGVKTTSGGKTTNCSPANRSVRRASLPAKLSPHGVPRFEPTRTATTSPEIRLSSMLINVQKAEALPA